MPISVSDNCSDSGFSDSDSDAMEVNHTDIGIGQITNHTNQSDGESEPLTNSVFELGMEEENNGQMLNHIYATNNDFKNQALAWEENAQIRKSIVIEVKKPGKSKSQNCLCKVKRNMKSRMILA